MKADHHISGSLTQTEKNYNEIEKEGLALIFTVQRFHKMLFGRKFTLHTDHKQLLSMDRKRVYQSIPQIVYNDGL